MIDVKGIHYRSAFFYNAATFLKLGMDLDRRYQVASRYVRSGESVLDVCSGPGKLRKFMPAGCTYRALDASPQFLAAMRKKGVDTLYWDLHAGWPSSMSVVDVIVMVISLSQFRRTSAGELLETFKKAAKRTVILEDVLFQSRGEKSLFQKIANYLCGADYYVPVNSWYTRTEFEHLMQVHGYRCASISRRYMVGLYGFREGMDLRESSRS